MYILYNNVFATINNIGIEGEREREKHVSKLLLMGTHTFCKDSHD